MTLRIVFSLFVVLASQGWTQPDTLPRGAVAQRSIRASASMEAFRPVGDLRVWRFFAKQTTFGQLTSTVTGLTEIDGRAASTLRESLQIDFARIGGEAQTNVVGDSYVTSEGRFAGCDVMIGPVEQTERLVLSREDARLTGYYTRGGEENEISLPGASENFFWDPYLVDQLEIFLALHDLEIGTVISDSIFLPQSLIHARIAGEVIYFMWQEIYKGKIDSVFVIRLTEPSAYQLYFTPDKKLVRVDMIDQNIRVYQDLVRQVAMQSPSETSSSNRAPFSPRALLFKLPHYFAFTVVLGLSVLLLAARAFKWSVSYLSLLAGAALCVTTVLVMNPALIWISQNWIDLRSASGSSLYLAGTVLPLVTGLIQVVLIGAGIFFIARQFGARPYQWCGIGAFLGGAFGLAESIYVSGWQIELLFTWALLERTAMIVMHAASGALIGRFINGDRAHLAGAVVVAALVNGAMRYLPLLVQTRKIDLQAVHFVMAAGVTVYLLVVVILSRRSTTRGHEPTAGGEPEQV